MKNLKFLMLSMFATLMLNVAILQANAATTHTQQQAKAKTETAAKTAKKPADGRTKTGDKIDKTLKGPNGETVYTGSKGGKYYLNKKEEKVYLKKE